MKLLYFGPIDVENVEEYYEAKTLPLTVGCEVELDLNFDENTTDPVALAKVNRFLKDLETHLSEAMTAIAVDFDKGEESETSQGFLQFHLDEFDEEEIVSIFGANQVTRELFLKSIEPCRVGFYPEDDDAFVIVDITLRNEVTNYLMAVTFDSGLKINSIAMES